MVEVKCSVCGASPTLEAVKSGSCSFCNTALPHAVRAAAQAMMMRELMADRDGDGVPDALQALEQVQTAQQKREADEQELEQLKSMLKNCTNARVTGTGIAIRTAVLTAVLGLAWFFFTTDLTKNGPWFGRYVDARCAESCGGRSPLVYLGWSVSGTKRGGGTIFYCTHPQLINGGWSSMMSARDKNRPYEFPGGAGRLVVLSMLTMFLPALSLCFAYRRRQVARMKGRIPDLTAQVQALESKLTIR